MTGGCLSSCPDETSAKPRRIFALTELGRYSLKNWELSLQRHLEHVQHLLRAMSEESGAPTGTGSCH